MQLINNNRVDRNGLKQINLDSILFGLCLLRCQVCFCQSHSQSFHMFVFVYTEKPTGRCTGVTQGIAFNFIQLAGQLKTINKLWGFWDWAFWGGGGVRNDKYVSRMPSCQLRQTQGAGAKQT